MLHSTVQAAIAFLTGAIVLATAACSGETFSLEASGPYPYPAVVNPSMERVAILVTIRNRSGDDLTINPADFVARDSARRVYPADAKETAAEARLASGPPSMRGALPLPTMTLRSDDVLSGFVVFDVPAGVRPAELIWRQSDSDRVVSLSPS